MRYISAADVRVGDTIRVTWTTGAIDHSRVAKVLYIHESAERYGMQRVSYWADENCEQQIFEVITGITSPVRVTLLDGAQSRSQLALFEV